MKCLVKRARPLDPHVTLETSAAFVAASSAGDSASTGTARAPTARTFTRACARAASFAESKRTCQLACRRIATRFAPAPAPPPASTTPRAHYRPLRPSGSAARNAQGACLLPAPSRPPVPAEASLMLSPAPAAFVERSTPLPRLLSRTDRGRCTSPKLCLAHEELVDDKCSRSPSAVSNGTARAAPTGTARAAPTARTFARARAASLAELKRPAAFTAVAAFAVFAVFTDAADASIPSPSDDRRRLRSPPLADSQQEQGPKWKSAYLHPGPLLYHLAPAPRGVGVHRARPRLVELVAVAHALRQPPPLGTGLTLRPELVVSLHLRLFGVTLDEVGAHITTLPDPQAQPHDAPATSEHIPAVRLAAFGALLAQAVQPRAAVEAR
eukprot:scaffold57895_cov62-Phaeocystis_antarctica.AAC.9